MVHPRHCSLDYLELFRRQLDDTFRTFCKVAIQSCTEVTGVEAENALMDPDDIGLLAYLECDDVVE